MVQTVKNSWEETFTNIRDKVISKITEKANLFTRKTLKTNEYSYEETTVNYLPVVVTNKVTDRNSIYYTSNPTNISRDYRDSEDNVICQVEFIPYTSKKDLYFTIKVYFRKYKLSNTKLTSPLFVQFFDSSSGYYEYTSLVIDNEVLDMFGEETLINKLSEHTINLIHEEEINTLKLHEEKLCKFKQEIIDKQDMLNKCFS